MKNPNAIINSDYGLIIININDTTIGKSISQNGYWAIEDINLIKMLIDIQLQRCNSITFYDVGANIGTHSLALSKCFPEKIKIRAFEAQRQIYNMLCGTVAINGLQNVYCHNIAIGDKDGETLQLNLPDYDSPNNFGGFELIKPLTSDNQDLSKFGAEVVSTIRIDSFDEKVDFIKMDIEGMEDKALSGSVKTIETHRPICFVETMKSDINFIFEFFKSRNYIGFQKEFDLIAIPFEYELNITGINGVF